MGSKTVKVSLDYSLSAIILSNKFRAVLTPYSPQDEARQGFLKPQEKIRADIYPRASGKLSVLKSWLHADSSRSR